MRPRLTIGLVIFLSALLVYLVSLNAIWAADHPTSFLQLDYAIWANHSFAIGKAGQPLANSIDDFQYRGYYYSALAPGAPVLALPFVGLGFMLDGNFTQFGYALLMSEVFVALCNSIAAYLVYRIGSLFFRKPTSVFLAFTYAFSTITWPFATYFFQSDVTAMLALSAVYFAVIAARSKNRGSREAVFSGASVAVAMTTDYVSAILLPLLLGYLLFSTRRGNRGPGARILWFFLTSCAGILLLGLYNQATLGSIFVTPEQVYRNSSNVFTNFTYPLYMGLFLNLLSPLRGIFVYTPFLLLGVPGLYIMYKRSGYRMEGLLFLACLLGVLIPYSMWYDPIGGEGFGPRFLITGLPFLLLPSGFILERRSSGIWVLSYLLYTAGTIMNGIAGVTNALPPVMGLDASPFFNHVLPLFLIGGLDTWWIRAVGEYWEIPAVTILVTAITLPAVTLWAIKRHDSATP